MAQLPNYKTTHYTLEEGLPSNECHRILQDNQGYIWIATDRGLVRFDGYDFKIYSLKEGLFNPSILELFYAESNNTLYMLAFGSDVFEMNLDTEEINVFKCQDKVNLYKSSYRINEMHISQAGDFYFELSGYGLLKINETCESEIVEEEFKSEDYAKIEVVKIDSSAVIAYAKTFINDNHDKLELYFTQENNIKKRAIPIVYRDLQYDLIVESGYYLNSRAKTFYWNDSTLIFSLPSANLILHNNEIIKVSNDNTILDIIKLKSGALVLGRNDGGGLEYYENIEAFKNREKQYFLPNQTPSCIFQDKYENLWVSTLDNGFFKLSKNIFQNVLKDKVNTNITNVLSFEDQIFYIEKNKGLFEYKYGEHKVIYDSIEFELNDLKLLDDNSIFVGGQRTFTIDKKGKIDFVYGSRKGINYIVQAKKLKIFDDHKFWLSSSDFGFHTDLKKMPDYYSRNNNTARNFRILDAHRIDDEVYLFARKDGLYYFKDSNPTKITTDHPELNVRINSIAKKNQWYILATQGFGVVFWDLKDQIYSVQRKQGLCTDNTEEIFVHNDFIYVLTKAGLSQLKGDPISGFEVRCLNSKHGLPSNQINKVQAKNDSLLIATSKGLVSFDQVIQESQLTVPKIEFVKADNTSIIKDTSVHHSLNDIQYQFKTLDYSLEGDINYRYKLNKQDWNYTNSTRVDFPDLNPGFYSFQVQSQNNNAAWGDSEVFEFSIKPPWWQYLSVRILFGCLLALMAFAIYQRRLKQIEKKFQIEKEMRDLEKSALAAQMNPHFIFNCLNSIQNFVMKNEKEFAMEYLGKFAQLIRGNLNASVESSVTLFDEIKMLSNYLSLEQLRLNDSFEFDIIHDEEIDPNEIEIPAMLIQPFVENAVLHGMKNTTANGLIKIEFNKVGEHLNVSVFNTMIEGDQKEKIHKKHKSFGTKITQKRLAFINDMPVQNIKVTPINSGQGKEVKLSIKLK